MNVSSGTCLPGYSLTPVLDTVAGFIFFLLLSAVEILLSPQHTHTHTRLTALSPGLPR